MMMTGKALVGLVKEQQLGVECQLLVLVWLQEALQAQLQEWAVQRSL